MATYSQAESSLPATPSKGHVWGTIGFVLLGYNVLIAALITAPAFLLPAMGVHLDLRGMATVILTGSLAGELLALWWLIRHLRRSGRTLSDIGWKRPTTGTAITVAIIFGLLYAANALFGLHLLDQAREISLFKVYGLVVGVIGAIIEEIIFRGFIITQLNSIKASTALQIAVSGLTFALIHIGFDIGGTLTTLIMGLILASIYIFGRRSLTPTVLSHALINAVIEPWLVLFITAHFAAEFSH